MLLQLYIQINQCPKSTLDRVLSMDQDEIYFSNTHFNHKASWVLLNYYLLHNLLHRIKRKTLCFVNSVMFHFVFHNRSITYFQTFPGRMQKKRSSQFISTEHFAILQMMQMVSSVIFNCSYRIKLRQQLIKLYIRKLFEE